MRRFHHDIPGPFVIVLQILSGAIAGLFIAGVYLALKPVKAVDAAEAAAPADEAAESTERNVVTYVAGNPGHPGGQQWRLRERAFLEKATAGVAVSEEDINRWIQTTYGSEDRRLELKSYNVILEPTLPLCRVNGEEFQVGIEYVCSVGKSRRSIVAHARGRFEKQGDSHVFVPSTVFLGSCPLPGRLGAMLVEKLGATYSVPENVSATWKAVTAARVEESRLKLAFN